VGDERLTLTGKPWPAYTRIKQLTSASISCVLGSMHRLVQWCNGQQLVLSRHHTGLHWAEQMQLFSRLTPCPSHQTHGPIMVHPLWLVSRHLPAGLPLHCAGAAPSVHQWWQSVACHSMPSPVRVAFCAGLLTVITLHAPAGLPPAPLPQGSPPPPPRLTPTPHSHSSSGLHHPTCRPLHHAPPTGPAAKRRTQITGRWVRTLVSTRITK
jgi:hypothetical protein